MKFLRLTILNENSKDQTKIDQSPGLINFEQVSMLWGSDTLNGEPFNHSVIHLLYDGEDSIIIVAESVDNIAKALGLMSN